MKKRFLFLLIAAVLALSACGKPSTDTAEAVYVPEDLPQQALPITVQQDDNISKAFSSEELAGNFSNGMSYKHLKDVSLWINGRYIPLEDALAEGEITEEEIFCLVRTDARNGSCVETYESFHGVAHYTYEYPDYNLLLIHDVYETPDGKQHPISLMKLYAPRSMDGYTRYQEGPYHGFLDNNGKIDDKEDWGLTFSAKDVSPTGLVLESEQAGGQQTGELVMIGYDLDDGDRALDRLDASTEIPSIELPITMNGSGEYVLDWTDVYGPLSAGEYTLNLFVADRFDEETVHPLLQNFTDHEWFTVSVTIP